MIAQNIFDTRWSFTKLKTLSDLSYGDRFYGTHCRSQFLCAAVKELLKSDSIC